ncbi:WD40 repeat-like protein [Durotheca rogersii]|uniref:WD40 repeat-like protein n=1 Tax=Durotheca rogersii TaxID=419775 RepID=UPI002220B38D|nr:WD40 repeat-like protein [Durotheca rogersii]KAI5866674.1 WD40 repeat-like protein [Durotheca rogersii]
MPSAIGGDEWDLPRLKASIGFEDDFQYLSSDDQQDTEFFDVKFYPYGDVTHDPVFAAISKKHIVIYRLSTKANPPYELIQLFRDDDKEALNCSCTWSKDPETEAPYLCVAGRDAKIKVYDVVHGKLVKVLIGHGGEINDLATCPTDFLLIASASEDTTVRIWSLDPAHSKQPCVCLLAGEGHSSGLLTVAFHNGGRYVLSAGHDNVISLWTLPDLPPKTNDKNPPQPIVIHYPHFFTSEVHSGIVDCVAFFGDLVLSRACHEDIIVLWRIEGFSSRDPVPAASEAPTTSDTERLTRSAFAPATAASACPPQYTRLLEFWTPHCGHQFYLRFRLFHDRDRHPVLAFGNAKATVFFWDLARLGGYRDFVEELREQRRDPTLPPVRRPAWLQPIQHRQQQNHAHAHHHHGGSTRGDTVGRLRDAVNSDKDSVASGRTGSVDIASVAENTTATAAAAADSSYSSYTSYGYPTQRYSQETLDAWELKYDMTRVEEPVRAHAQSSITVKDFVGRQVAWSPRGEWCVVVGSKNLAIVLQRWQHATAGGSHAGASASESAGAGAGAGGGGGGDDASVKKENEADDVADRKGNE